jgi:FKBP-type peptidyl-prolyl cis-trans isomerase
MKKLTKNEKVGVAIAVVVFFGMFIISAPNVVGSIFTTKDNQGTLATPVVTNDTSNNLKIQDVVLGSGLAAEPGDMVSVKYTGKLMDGTTFDSSALHGGVPISFRLGTGKVIKGWDSGLIGMKAGGKRVLLVPPDLGYGIKEYGPIPANSTLYFEIQLVSVN